MSEIRLFATPPHKCSYINEKIATTVFVDPDVDLDSDSYQRLSSYGFRRSGSHFYRPNCDDCSACLSVRVPVHEFSPSRSQKRCIKRNQDLTVKQLSSLSVERHYELYRRYILERHADGDMYPPSRQQFTNFLAKGHDTTVFFEFTDPQDQVLAVAVTDILDDHLSAVYTFFDPDMDDRGLGVNSILYQIRRSREMGVRSLYLGYLVRECKKMNYKTAYSPLEVLTDSGWIREEALQTLHLPE